MEIIIIAAVAKNRVIGNEGKLPWHIPDDLQRFKKLTMGQAVIMGRKTCKSILKKRGLKKGKPLQGRINIVLSTNEEYCPEVNVARTLEEALEIADCFRNFAYVIGGEQVYRQAMPLASRMELTEIHKDYTGDAFFPEFGDEWRETRRDEREFQGLKYDFVSYRRKEAK